MYYTGIADLTDLPVWDEMVNQYPSSILESISNPAFFNLQEEMFSKRNFNAEQEAKKMFGTATNSKKTVPQLIPKNFAGEGKSINYFWFSPLLILIFISRMEHGRGFG